MKEMPATLLLRPFGLNTLAVDIWERTSEAMWREAAVPALTPGGRRPPARHPPGSLGLAPLSRAAGPAAPGVGSGKATTWSTRASAETRVPAGRIEDDGCDECTRSPEGRPDAVHGLGAAEVASHERGRTVGSERRT